MNHQSQDGRVDRATSRRWSTPVTSAGLRVVVMAGFAGAAWLLGGSSAAHAETVTTADAVQPATSGILGSLSRPLAAVATPVTTISAATASPHQGKAGGALAPATTPVSEAVRVARAPVSTATHVLGAATRAVARDTGLRPPPAGSVDSAVAAITAVPENPLSPLGTGRVTKVIATLGGGPTEPAGHAPAGDQGGRTAAPRQRVLPVPDAAGILPAATARPVLPADAPRIRTVSTLDSVSSPAAGASSVAPALSRPAPGNAPVLPGAGLMNSGNTASSSTSQFGGPAGAIVAGTQCAASPAPGECPLPLESVAPLVRAEELAAVPD